MPSGKPNLEEQTPAEILDYTINWGSFGLGTDTIVSSSWAVTPSDLIDNSPAPSFTSTMTTVWLSGATAGIYYLVTNTINTAGGREMQYSFILKCIPQRLR